MQAVTVCIAAGVFSLGCFVLVLVITRTRTGTADGRAAARRTRDVCMWTAATLQTIAQIGQQVRTWYHWHLDVLAPALHRSLVRMDCCRLSAEFERVRQ